MKTDPPIKKHYFKFRPEFVPDVRAGIKSCTIRGTRKRLPKVGEIAVLETWSAKPYASPVERIAESPLKEVRPVQIEAWDGRDEGIKIIFDGVELIGKEARRLATDDGFPNLQAFADFFRPRLPFEGHFFEWFNITAVDL